MLPQTFSRQLVGADCVVTAPPGAKTIAIQHIETVHLPASPICDFPPETDWYASHAKIQIRQLGERFAIAVAPLQYDGTSSPDLFGH